MTVQIPYEVYQGLLCVPIVLAYGIYILPICACVYTACTKSRNKPVPAAWRAIINITLIGGLKSETTENGRKRYFLFNYPVTPGYVRSIGMFTIALWVSLIVTFWLNFTINVTGDCKNGVDCFLNGTMRINDCRSLDVYDSVQCYEIPLDFINGARTAGGLLAISVTIFYGQLSAQAWIEKKKTKSKKKRCFKALSILLGVLPLTVLILLFVSSVIKLLVISAPINLYKSIINYMNAVLYLVPLLILSCYPLCKKTRLSTDLEEDSPGPDSYTLMEDGHESINDNYTEEQPKRTRAHTTI